MTSINEVFFSSYARLVRMRFSFFLLCMTSTSHTKPAWSPTAERRNTSTISRSKLLRTEDSCNLRARGDWASDSVAPILAALQLSERKKEIRQRNRIYLAMETGRILLQTQHLLRGESIRLHWNSYTQAHKPLSKTFPKHTQAHRLHIAHTQTYLQRW